MKIICISDTHSKHNELTLPEGDMIIHAGDVSRKGTAKEVNDFLDWFGSLDYRYKIFIAGNHDFHLEKLTKREIQLMLPEGVTYLNDSYVTVEGLKIWGSPVQPWFYDWAFNRERGDDIKKHWDLIPSDIDVLITHGPAFGILDKTIEGENVGCKDLLDKVKKISPKLSVCGHIHEDYGVKEIKGTTFINASVLNIEYECKNRPVVVVV